MKTKEKITDDDSYHDYITIVNEKNIKISIDFEIKFKNGFLKAFIDSCEITGDDAIIYNKKIKINDNLLVNLSFEKEVEKIILVTKEGKDYLKNILLNYKEKENFFNDNNLCGSISKTQYYILKDIIKIIEYYYYNKRYNSKFNL